MSQEIGNTRIPYPPLKKISFFDPFNPAGLALEPSDFKGIEDRPAEAMKELHLREAAAMNLPTVTRENGVDSGRQIMRSTYITSETLVKMLEDGEWFCLFVKSGKDRYKLEFVEGTSSEDKPGLLTPGEFKMVLRAIKRAESFFVRCTWLNPEPDGSIEGNMILQPDHGNPAPPSRWIDLVFVQQDGIWVIDEEAPRRAREEAAQVAQ
ncbi:TPA: hypothetical protein DD449_02270 [Candidatus Berkelbacteria bacterium]|uniref:Uncharacterized protein n=1 Tax=Berkelbacteria bacterium GW2011_GWE1_39_12 TaxID=1618337 RepID=A0A0G4B2V5_9BACT|nr:MAG: hypothetical protein UT28_C0001G0094 [Berkelbacteria bacterium GW2011_GWE1_39_12]HBO60482.1 hypothetical protein [Candidatus Berkelbacteria bacterium]